MAPDIDLLIPGVVHRTITHSVILAFVAFTPFLLLFRSRALPYFAALLQHTLIGDFVTGGTQGWGGTKILWPLDATRYGLPNSVFSPLSIALEWSFFLATVAVMVKTRDLHRLFEDRQFSAALTIPILLLAPPLFLRYPGLIPIPLLIPYIAILLILVLAVARSLRGHVTRRPPPLQNM
jgi:membrane-bound metal-dependent hydrolase YbcI (DUF457 family)